MYPIFVDLTEDDSQEEISIAVDKIVSIKTKFIKPGLEIKEITAINTGQVDDIYVSEPKAEVVDLVETQIINRIMWQQKGS